MMPHSFFGPGSSAHLASALQAYHVSTLLVFGGGRSYAECGAARVIDALPPSVRIIHVTVQETLPEITSIGRYLDIIRSERPDAVLAVGGGHVIDTAKLANVIAANRERFDRDTLASFVPVVKGLPLIVMPTTAGSGSEATHFAVAYEGKAKYSVAAPFMVPDVAIIDPEFAMSAPMSVRAASGADALCQAVESFWAAGATPDSRVFAAEAIGLIIRTIIPWIPSHDPAVAARMLKGSYLAGKAINISKTTAPHALSYYLTSKFGIPHGQAVAVFLPEFLLFNCEPTLRTNPTTGSSGDHALPIAELLHLLGASSPADASAILKHLFQSIGLKTDLRSLGIPFDTVVNDLPRSVNLQRLNNNPRVPTYNDLVSLIEKMYH